MAGGVGETHEGVAGVVGAAVGGDMHSCLGPAWVEGWLSTRVTGANADSDPDMNAKTHAGRTPAGHAAPCVQAGVSGALTPPLPRPHLGD